MNEETEDKNEVHIIIKDERGSIGQVLEISIAITLAGLFWIALLLIFG